MATEMMEYRPGKWVKVIDGKIVGRATAKEVAAWQASRATAVQGLNPLSPVGLCIHGRNLPSAVQMGRVRSFSPIAPHDVCSARTIRSVNLVLGAK